jgi:hypothetical protein
MLASKSPFGTMDQSSFRKTLFYLIGALNASFPDYDFSDIKPEQFTKIPSIPLVINTINTTLNNHGKGMMYRDMRMWDAVDIVMELDDCDVYSFVPDTDADPYMGSLWSFNYFFFNKKLKRIMFLSIHATSRQNEEQPLSSDDDLDMEF